MILKLNDSHKTKLIDFLKVEKEINLFMLGDLENYGIDEFFLEYWAEFDENEEMTAVLMRYYKDFIVYSRKEFDVSKFSEIIKRNGYNNLSGEKSVVEKFSECMGEMEKRNMHFARLDEDNKLYKGEMLQNAVKTKVEDAPGIWRLHRIVNGGKDLYPLERLEKKIIDKAGRGYHLVNADGEMISSVETTAENSSSAMITGVCTHPDCRGSGHASALVSRLCMDLFAEGKTVCLFYDNPVAGKIYENLGFDDIASWSLWKSKGEA